jgi:aryl-alcohol dehydrogenase-like predicted oxidoreductase
MAGRSGPWTGTLSAEEVERAYHELGINAFLVTPRMKGLAEGVRRLIRSGHRDQIVIMSGVAIPTAGRVRSYWRSCTSALETDRIDLYLIGWVQARWYLRSGVWGAMQQLKNDGRVGALGFSIHNRKLAASLVGELDPGPDFMMIRYNAAHRGAETEIFDQLPEPAPGMVAYTATRWGDLLKPRPDEGFEHGMSAPECYRFALTQPAVTTVLCGARTWQELQDDVDGVRQGPLAGDRLEEVRQFGDAVHANPRRRSSHYSFDR